MSALSAFYVKNVPPLERALRGGMGALGAVAALVLLPSPWSMVGAGVGLMMATTGVVGFCPACALVGRKLDAAGHRPA